MLAFAVLCAIGCAIAGRVPLEVRVGVSCCDFPFANSTFDGSQPKQDRSVPDEWVMLNNMNTNQEIPLVFAVYDAHGFVRLCQRI